MFIFNRMFRFFSPEGAEGVTGGGSPALATGTTAPGVSGPPPGTTAQSDSSSGADQFREPAQLRTAYDSMKKEYEPWKALGSIDEVKQAQQIYSAALTELTPLATKLGYNDQELRDAVKELGITKVTAFLYGEANKGTQQQQQQQVDPIKQLEEKLTQQIQPLLTERQQQQIDQAYTRIEAKGKELATAKFGSADDLKDNPGLADDLFDYASAMMAQDPTVVARLRAGNMNDLPKFIDLAYERLQKSYQMFGNFMQKRGTTVGTNGTQRQTQQQQTKLTLDDIINGNDKATQAMQSMR